MTQFHELRVKSIERETVEAVSVGFEVPAELKEKFKYVAGQYLTLEKEIAGKKLRRSYSICTSPESGQLKVAVKEAADGQFSAWVNNKLKEGDYLNVFLPEGRFVYNPPVKEKEKTYVAFVAGSGITPVMAILQSVLYSEKNSKFVLVYGNKSPDQTIFYKDLLRLQALHRGRLFIEFVYSRFREEEAFYGRIERSTVHYIMRNKFKEAHFSDFFLCGPKPMIDMVSLVLREEGIEPEQIHFELFETETKDIEPEKDDGEMTEITVILDGEEHTFQMKRSTRVLNAVMDEGMDPPYSCQGGICSTCLAVIQEGEAEMANNMILTPNEVEEGLVLTCQAHPISPKITIDYDDL